jgi:hypothetical protein
MRNILFIMLLISIGLPNLEAIGADWKYYGSAKFRGEDAITFYDAENVRYGHSGKVKVWVEVMRKSEFDAQMKAHEKQIAGNASKKLLNGYSPPYSLVDKRISFEDSVQIIAWEEMANSGGIGPYAKMLFKINCDKHKIRTLSATTFKKDGDIESSTQKTDWDYISPESNGEYLQKILCR